MFSTRHLFALFVVSRVTADDSTYFVHPPRSSCDINYTKNPTYEFNTTLDVQWVTNLTSYGLYLWQVDLSDDTALTNGPIKTMKTAASSAIQHYNWRVDVQGFDINQSPVFMLVLALNDTFDGAIMSHPFNMTVTGDGNDDEDDEDTTIYVTATVTLSDRPANSTAQTTTASYNHNNNYTTTTASKIPYSYKASTSALASRTVAPNMTSATSTGSASGLGKMLSTSINLILGICVGLSIVFTIV